MKVILTDCDRCEDVAIDGEACYSGRYKNLCLACYCDRRAYCLELNIRLYRMLTETYNIDHNLLSVAKLMYLNDSLN